MNSSLLSTDKNYSAALNVVLQDKYEKSNMAMLYNGLCRAFSVDAGVPYAVHGFIKSPKGKLVPYGISLKPWIEDYLEGRNNTDLKHEIFGERMYIQINGPDYLEIYIGRVHRFNNDNFDFGDSTTELSIVFNSGWNNLGWIRYAKLTIDFDHMTKETIVHRVFLPVCDILGI